MDGVVGKAKCPKNNNKKKSLTHFKTMPQAAGKKFYIAYGCTFKRMHRIKCMTNFDWKMG